MNSTTKHNIDVIAQNPAFSACSPIEISRLVPHLREAHIKAGESLFLTQENPTATYIIKSGKVTLRSGKRRGKEITQGMIVGQEAAVGFEAHQADAIADEDTDVIVIPAQAIQPLMAQNKTFNSNIHRSFLNLYTLVTSTISESPQASPVIEKIDYKLVTGWLLAIILPMLVMHFAPGWGFNWNSTVFIAIASATIAMWVFAVVPEFVPAIFAMLSLVILGVVPEAIVLSGFTSSSFFMAVGIFGLGAVLLASGLTYRIVLHLLKILPKRQSAFGIGLMGIGLMLTPIIPSANGRSNLIAPIFLDMMNTLRYQSTAKAATALSISAFAGLSLFSPVFLTSKSANFVVYGMLPEQIREQFSWLYWLVASLAAAITMLLLLAILLKTIFRNQEIPAISRDKVQAQLDILGPTQSHEWAALVGILFLAIGILTGSLHKISPAWVALIILYVFLTVGIFSRSQFRLNIDWSFLFLLAGMIGIIKTMSYVGIDQWFSTKLDWLIPYMKHNFSLFVLLLSVSIILVRFIIPNNPTIMIFSAIFIPVAETSGVNPWVVVFIILMMSDTWFLRYQCTYYLVFSETANHDQQYDEKALLKFNVLTNAIRLVAIYVSIPFWTWLDIL